jgi:DNA-binding MarR family transcriptional regulator
VPDQDRPGPGRPGRRSAEQEHGEPDRDETGRDETGRDETSHDETGHEEPDHQDWGAPPAGASAERQRLENDFLLALRRAGSIMQLLGQVSADRLGINATDLNCLNLVALTGSMTAGELARATGLTTASITGVLDRLEAGGFVRRERDPHDRRRVIVYLGGGPGLREIGPTFAPLVKAWRATAAGYSYDELHLLLDFQRQLEEIMRGQLARLRGDSGEPRGTGG